MITFAEFLILLFLACVLYMALRPIQRWIESALQSALRRSKRFRASGSVIDVTPIHRDKG